MCKIDVCLGVVSCDGAGMVTLCDRVAKLCRPDTGTPISTRASRMSADTGSTRHASSQKLRADRPSSPMKLWVSSVRVSRAVASAVLKPSSVNNPDTATFRWVRKGSETSGSVITI